MAEVLDGIIIDDVEYSFPSGGGGGSTIVTNEMDVTNFELMNYGLFVQEINNSSFSANGSPISKTNWTRTTLCLLDKGHDIYPGLTGTSAEIWFFDAEKTPISKVVGKYSTKPLTKSEMPENAVFVAFAFQTSYKLTSEFATDRNGDSGFFPKAYSKTKKLKGTRPKIYIYTTDTESEILFKLCDAILTEDCDVIWQTGAYNFSQIYVDMGDTYGLCRRSGAYQRELPLGGNCRYYLNNSIIIGTKPSAYSDVKVFGNTRVGNCPFEMYDGTIKGVNMVYCVHDEGQFGDGYYQHRYKNIHFVLEGGTRCLGCGSAKFGKIVVEDCVFENSNNVTDFACHGTTQTTDVISRFDVVITNCWFEHGAQVNSRSTNQTCNVLYSGNSAKNDLSVADGWLSKKFNNEIRG